MDMSVLVAQKPACLGVKLGPWKEREKMSLFSLSLLLRSQERAGKGTPGSRSHERPSLNVLLDFRSHAPSEHAHRLPDRPKLFMFSSLTGMCWKYHREKDNVSQSIKLVFSAAWQEQFYFFPLLTYAFKGSFSSYWIKFVLWYIILTLAGHQILPREIFIRCKKKIHVCCFLDETRSFPEWFSPQHFAKSGRVTLKIRLKRNWTFIKITHHNGEEMKSYTWHLLCGGEEKEGSRNKEKLFADSCMEVKA